MSTNTSRFDLAIAVLALDEQETIAATIEQAKRIAAGVYVLDCGSRDATVEIAEQHGATVVSTNWPFSFAVARNTLLSEIPYDYRYVLWLNAGETLGHETESLLTQFLATEAQADKAYSIMVEVPPAMPDASAEQVLQLRLFPHRPGIRFVGRVGETATASLRQLGVKQDMAPGRILCHARRHTAVWKARRAQRNLHLATLEAPDPKNRPARIWRIMGEALTDLGHTTAACEAFREAISVAENGSTEQLEAYYGLLAAMDSDPNLHGSRIAACLEALDVFPLDAQLLCAMGTYLQSANRIDLAIRSFELAVTYGQVDLETWHVQEIAEMASVCWALALQLNGDHEKAETVYRDALERFPNSPRVRRRAAEHFIKQSKVDDALAAAEALAATDEEREALFQAIRGGCAAARQDWKEALARLQTAYLSGCRHPICLRWLAVVLLSLGETQSVVPILEQWIAQEPQTPEPRAYLEAIRKRGAGTSSPESAETTTVSVEPPAGEVASEMTAVHEGDAVEATAMSSSAEPAVVTQTPLDQNQELVSTETVSGAPAMETRDTLEPSHTEKDTTEESVPRRSRPAKPHVAFETKPNTVAPEKSPN
ncbi:hypothetical protein JCM19992_23290 [Thermostilla marina]